MAQMVRKQIYIQQRHKLVLKQLSEAAGVSEAEIIRRAIEREVVGDRGPNPEPDPLAWEKIVSFIEGRKASPKKYPYKWRRQDAYEPREGKSGESKSTKMR